MISSVLHGIWGSPHPPPPHQRLRRWRLVGLPARRPTHWTPSTQESEGGSNDRIARGSEKSSREPPGRGVTAFSGESDDYIEVSPLFTSPLGLFLIRLRLLRTLGRTIPQSELLALCRLAKARATLQGTPPCLQHSPKSQDEAEQPVGSPSQSGELQTQKHEQPEGGRRLRVDPLDVCALLMSGEMEVDDLPFLKELNEVAQETETKRQREGHWRLGAWLLRLLMTRGDLWESAAAKLQERRLSASNGSSSRMARLIDMQRDTQHTDCLLPSNMSVATGDTMGMGGRAPRVPFMGPRPGGMSPKGLSLGLPSRSAGEKSEPLSPRPRGLSPGGNLRGPLNPWCLLREKTPEDTEAAVKAAAATISRMGSEELALLPHNCKFPLTSPAKTRGSAASNITFSPPWSLQGAPLQEPTHVEVAEDSGTVLPSDGWKAAVGFRPRRSRMGSRRRRELMRKRQRLSPLDPPYDANALLIHPFCPVTDVDLPDVEDARASEVHEVSLDFLGRCKATVSCPQCSKALVSSKSTTGGDGMPQPLCPLHQRLHYKKVGEGPEKVILIHGICMSGYFFADVIRALLPDSAIGGGPGDMPGSDEDPYERWRFTFYCVDLLGYGKSSAVPATQNYSRREQAEAILRDVILANGFTSVHLVGHSFGGLVAAELCEILPIGFVTTLILLAPAYFESERQATRILSTLQFPASHTIAHPYFGEFLLRLGVMLRPFFEPIILSIVPKEELPQLSVADVFSIRPDALTGTILSIVQDRVDRTFQLLRQRGQRASLFHGTDDGVIPIRQARFLALRYPNIHLRALVGFVHHFPASHAQFTADIIIQEINRSLRNGRGLSFSLDGDPANSLIASHALLLPGHPTWE